MVPFLLNTGFEPVGLVCTLQVYTRLEAPPSSAPRTESVVVVPETVDGVEVAGEATVGAEFEVTVTATVTLEVTVVLAAFVADKTYVVVAEGEMTTEVLPVTSPTPWLILREVAPVVDQFRVVVLPSERLDEAVVKLVICGAATTVTPTLEVALPEALVAVKIYVLLVVGVTGVVVEPVTSPTP